MHDMRNLGQDMRRHTRHLYDIIKTMHRRLVSYLRDNRDQILESWLTEADLPLPQGGSDLCGCQGTVPLSYLQRIFDQVMHTLQGKISSDAAPHLDDILGVTCTCRDRTRGGRVCIELHESGLRAFLAVFDEAWDADGEFSPLDRECCTHLINQSLSKVIQREIATCEHKHSRNDCPFV